VWAHVRKEGGCAGLRSPSVPQHARTSGVGGSTLKVTTGPRHVLDVIEWEMEKCTGGYRVCWQGGFERAAERRLQAQQRESITAGIPQGLLGEGC
jgi:hypothetical protein